MNYRYIRARLVRRGFTEKSSVGSYFAETNAIRQIFNGSWMNSGRNPVNVHTSNRRNGFSLLLGDKLFAPESQRVPVICRLFDSISARYRSLLSPLSLSLSRSKYEIPLFIEPMLLRRLLSFHTTFPIDPIELGEGNSIIR